MKRIPLLPIPVLGILSILLPASVQGVSDEQYKSIQALGRLNGIALQCNYLADTRRMKAALIKTLPRRRELGMAFDQATNESFLQFMEEGRSCPESGSFSGTVDRGIGSLEHSFPGSKAK